MGRLVLALAVVDQVEHVGRKTKAVAELLKEDADVDDDKARGKGVGEIDVDEVGDGDGHHHGP